MPSKNRKQLRRSISLHQDVFAIIAITASAENKSIAHFVEERLRAAGVEVPVTRHHTLRGTEIRMLAKRRNQQARKASDTASR